MGVHYSVWLLAIVVIVPTVRGEEPTKKIEHTAAAQTSPASGHDMFMSYCASCHGKDAQGDGPAAKALKVAPADLSALAKQNGGKYPSNKVTAILSGQADLVAHGNKEMPVWGAVFWTMSGGHAGEVQQRVANLNRYIEGLQVK